MKTEYKNHTIIVEQDTDCVNPRKDYDQLGKLTCWGRYSYLSDDITVSKTYSPSEYKEELEGKVHLPVYLYEHGMVTISTSPFSCQWDSGQIGYILLEDINLHREFNGNREQALKCLESEIAEFDQYLRGEVYYYQIEGPNGELTSCGGCYGEDYCLEEAKRAVDGMIKYALTKV